MKYSDCKIGDYVSNTHIHLIGKVVDTPITSTISIVVTESDSYAVGTYLEMYPHYCKLYKNKDAYEIC